MAEEKPPLEEILRDIPAEKLDQPCKDRHLCLIARHIPDWPALAPYLRIRRAEEDEIRGKWPFSVAGQRNEFLRRWYDKQGHKATYRRLCRAFWKLGEIALAEKVCDVICSSDSSSEGSEDEESYPTPSVPLKREPMSGLASSTRLRAKPTSKFVARSDPPVNPLDGYIKYLRDTYDVKLPQFFVLQWPPPPTRKVFNLAMVHSDTVQCGTVDTELIRSLQIGSVDAATKKRRSIQLNSIFKLSDSTRKIILIEGAPGAGKSTLAWHVCQKWNGRELFTQFKVVIFIHLRDAKVQAAQSVADLLPAESEEMRRDAAAKIKACRGRDVLFILDGWDEYGPGLQKGSVIRKLICEPDELGLHFSTLLVTSRPITSAALQRYASSRIEIVGFTPEELSHYFEEVLRNPASVQALREQLKERPIVEASCYLPLNAAIVSHLFIGLKHSLPRTLYQVFSALVCGCIIRQLTKEAGSGESIPEIPSLEELPLEVQKPFRALCTLAYEAVTKNKVSFSSKDLLSAGVSAECKALSLMQGMQSFLSGKSTSYHFLHLSVQELLAAQHISKLPPSAQVQIFEKLFREPRFEAVFRFYAAITKLQTAGIRSVVLKMTTSMNYQSTRLLSLLPCIYEAQDLSLCSFISSHLQGTLTFAEVELNPLECLCLGYFLSAVCLVTPGGLVVSLRSCSLDDHKISFLARELSKGGRGTTSAGGELTTQSSTSPPGYLTLKLVNNDIQARGVQYISGVLSDNPAAIRRLQFKNCKVDQGKDGLLYLCRALRTNTGLVSLSLCKCRITEGGAPILAEMLAENKALLSLNLSFNALGDSGIAHISTSLKVNSTLQELDISHCQLTADGVKDLTDSLTSNSSLTFLDLSWNKVLDAGAAHLENLLKCNTSLRKVQLLNCGITAKGAESIAVALRNNNSLEFLNLEQNPISDAGIVCIADAMQHNHNLRELILCKCELTDLGMESIAAALEVNTSLEKLDLSYNEKAERGLLTLGESLKKNQGLKTLIFISRPFSKFEEKIKDQFVLALSDCHLTELVTTALSDSSEQVAAVSEARRRQRLPKLEVASSTKAFQVF